MWPATAVTLEEVGDGDPRLDELVRWGASNGAGPARVVREKLVGAGPAGPPRRWVAFLGGRVVGTAVVAGNRLRWLAVLPAARGRGVGGALLAAAEAAARTDGHAWLRTLDAPGNYVSPGLEVAGTEAIAWFERRGYVAAERNHNLIVALHGNPRLSPAATAAAVARVTAAGYTVRRATGDEPALLDAIAHAFSAAWRFEVAAALTASPVGVHLAERDGEVVAFAAHDGNNQGMGWFGPTGTWPEHRGHGLGEALLRLCLDDVAQVQARCEIAWIGPREFYARIAGIAAEREFVVLRKRL